MILIMQKQRRTTMIDRILRAIRLDWAVFREIAVDESATMEAGIIVVVVSFLSAIGTGIASEGFFLAFILSWLLSVFVGWIGWAIITYFVGTMMFQGKTDIPEMMRVLGYASAPKLLGVFGFIPCVGWIFSLAGWILSLIAGILAVREAMEFDTANAIVTVVISRIMAFVITLVISLPVLGSMALFSGLAG
jgi:hypothetical protein